MGVPRPAVIADLIRRNLDTGLLDADPSTSLPEAMQETPVMIECTEIYLDERSFYEHVGSKDYLAAYGEVMEPALQNKQCTIRLGTPTAEIVDKILAPMLKERVEPLHETCVLWKRPSSESSQTSLFLAINALGSVDQVLGMLPVSIREGSTTFVAFAHPLREGMTRVLCVRPGLPDDGMWRDLAGIAIAGIEVHCSKAHCESVRDTIEVAAFGCQTVVSEVPCGYLIHERAQEVVERSDSGDVMDES